VFFAIEQNRRRRKAGRKKMRSAPRWPTTSRLSEPEVSLSCDLSSVYLRAVTVWLTGMMEMGESFEWWKMHLDCFSLLGLLM